MRAEPSERESSCDGSLRGGLGDGEAFAGASPAEGRRCGGPELYTQGPMEMNEVPAASRQPVL